MLPPKQRSQDFMKDLHWNWMEDENGFSLIPCPSSNPTCAQWNTQLAGTSRRRENIDCPKCPNSPSLVFFLLLYYPNYAWTILKISLKNLIPLSLRIMAFFTNETCKLLSSPLIVSIFNLLDDGTLRFPWQQLPAVGGSQAFSRVTIRVNHCWDFPTFLGLHYAAFSIF